VTTILTFIVYDNRDNLAKQENIDGNQTRIFRSACTASILLILELFFRAIEIYIKLPVDQKDEINLEQLFAEM